MRWLVRVIAAAVPLAVGVENAQTPAKRIAVRTARSRTSGECLGCDFCLLLMAPSLKSGASCKPRAVQPA